MYNINFAEEENIVEGVNLLEKGMEENNITYILISEIPIIPHLWNGNLIIH